MKAIVMSVLLALTYAGMVTAFAYSFLSMQHVPSLAPDRPAPKDAAKPAPVVDLSGEWTIGSKYLIEQKGRQFEIEGGDWKGTGNITDAGLIVIQWERGGFPAVGLYRLKDGIMVGDWGWLSDGAAVVDGELRGRINGETIRKVEVEPGPIQ